MIKLLNEWYTHNFSNPQVAILAMLLLIGSLIIIFVGDILAPLLAAVIIAYMLDGGVEFLRGYMLPRFMAVLLVFSAFIALLVLLLFVLAPMMFNQATQFVLEVPGMFAAGQDVLMALPENYPFLSQEVIAEITASIKNQISYFSQQVLSFSIASMVDIMAFMVYLIVVPLLVFFFLKDRDIILAWFGMFMPRDNQLATRVWREMHIKIAGYVRGKFLEILIVWVVTFITFLFFDLQYSMLLSFLVGISVLIPYVGAALVTIPVAVVAYFQWSLGNEFLYVMVAYTIIQFLDGNLLVPLLFSEMVNLHPAAIIAAVLFFGALWGVWGVFFAIPLATLIHAVMNAWPDSQRVE